MGLEKTASVPVPSARVPKEMSAEEGARLGLSDQPSPCDAKNRRKRVQASKRAASTFVIAISRHIKYSAGEPHAS
jgi:hypothetical protein